jgi:hypothetical protein
MLDDRSQNAIQNPRTVWIGFSQMADAIEHGSVHWMMQIAADSVTK